MPDDNGRETVDEFLARGGRINVIPPGQSALTALSENKRGRRKGETRGTELAPHIHLEIEARNARLAEQLNEDFE